MQLDERIEVAAGVHRSLSACSVDDLQGAQDIAAEKLRLKAEVWRLLLDASRRGVDVPEELRERLVAWSETLPASRQLHDQLKAIIRTAPSVHTIKGRE